MGFYLGMAFMVFCAYLGFRLARGILHRLGARWWTGLIGGGVALIVLSIGGAAFNAAGGQTWITRIFWWLMLALIAGAYQQVKALGR